MDQLASGTFEGPNVKTEAAGRNTRRHRFCLALGTRWPLNDHETRQEIGGSAILSVTLDAKMGGDGRIIELKVVPPLFNIDQLPN